MFNKISMLACLFLISGFAQAASNKPAPVATPVTADVAPATVDTPNPHKSRDQKLRDCHAQAAQQNLVGDAERKFIASCFRKS